MKRIICMLLVLVMCLGLCACGGTMTKNEHNANVDGFGPYIFIKDVNGEFNDTFHTNTWLGYHRDTKIVYECYGIGTNYGTILPHQIYQDGVIYGAVYKDGEIVPTSYALGLTLDMLGLASKYLN